MIKYRVSELIGDEILSRPVYLEDGQLILKVGTKMETSYKESLKTLNIHEVFIQDIFEEYERPNFFLEKNKIYQFCQELQEILSHHIYKENEGLKKIKSLAEKMVKEIEMIDKNGIFDIKDRTDDIYEHIIYTTIFVLVLGKEYNFSKVRMENMAIGSLLHDLGLFYIDISYQNCNKKKMTSEEVFELKRHTILAYTELEKEEWIPEISKKMILFHHEKMDGSGYPLKQKNLESECRIIQICDTFDRMRAGLETRKSSIRKALVEISNSHMYDADMAEILKSKIAIYPVGTRIELKNGEFVVVVAQTDHPSQPQVMSIEEKKIYPKPLKENIIHVF